MRWIITVGIGTGFRALLGHVDFAADDGLDTVGFGCIVELDRAEKITVIRHGDRRHFLLRYNLHELLDFARTIEQRIVSVVVEMNEREFRP